VDQTARQSVGILMKRNRVLTATVLTLAMLMVTKDSNAAPPDTFSIDDLPCWMPFSSDQYFVDPYIRIAGQLRAEGKEKSVEKLRALAKARNGEAIFILCRMLFVARPKVEFRRPSLGGAGFLGGTVYEDWPLEPIEIVDGIPFLIVDGYVLAGKPESPERYVDYCLKECDWGTADYKPRAAEEKKKALKSLITSKKWKQPLTDEEKKFLAAQIK
jgi:hypothetical protein